MSDLDSPHMTDPWSSFRLPVPLPKHADRDNGTICPFELPSYCSDEWIQRLIDLLRLLDVMKKAPISQERESTMKSQMVMAWSMMDTIECHFVPCLDHHRTSVNRMEEHELNFHANIDVLLNELRRGTRDVCQKFQDALERWNSMHREKAVQQRDFIAEIFLLPEDQSPLLARANHVSGPVDDYRGDVMEDSDSSQEEQEGESPAQQSTLNRKNTTQQQHRASSQHPPKELDPIEFQKQQQHLLEEELSTLATRLKSSTLAMNATLQSQTRDLEDFESLAQENLDVVSSTTQKVQDRLIKKKGWKKRLATWSLIATVVGMWVFCFMVMRTVPKRKIGSFSFNKWRRKSRRSDNDEYERESVIDEREKRRWDMWRERKRMQEEDQKRRWKQQQQQHNQQPGHPQQQSQQYHREQCEILSDGTQVCSDVARKFNFKAFSNSDRKAQQLLAERKRNRIEENMANAPLVNAIDSVDNDESVDVTAAEVVTADDEQRMEDAQRRDVVKEAAQSHRSHVENEVRETEMKSSAEEQDAILKREAEARATAEEAAEAQRWQKEQEEARAAADEEELRRQEEERRRRQTEEESKLQKEAEDRAREEATDAERRQKEQDAKAAEETAAAEEKRRLEEAERLRQIEQKARLQKEAADRAAQEAAEAERRQIEQDAKAAIERAAAEEKQRLEEAERLRRLEEEVRLQREAEMAAEAAAEKERLERERLEAIQREKLLTEEREKEIIERIRKEAAEEANAALQLAKQLILDSTTDIFPSDIRFVSGRGKNDLLAHYITTRPDMVDASDGSGWRPIHEAARGGNLAGLQLLIDSGCDLNAKTGRGGNGGTALWWAIQRYGEEHDVVRLLRSYGAPADGPDA
ncbi:hypothetical protein HJC23_000486 [Cyclotella cryptica]|uniref:t-SNARE coiled-coil homology domain-containing protein n=1 Tax=Cyclotella cryptica TaxID=29204 RepID=A0ABD3QA31_9STRA|eukprot:CCRYP_007239-RA/>CCRYP_007239-RA protein AED:0.06 eAED:0.06 QI:0/-1/0/1/-1/1/1/0/866